MQAANCAFLWQRQAGSRKQKAADVQGPEADENQWGRNWVERWVAVRPWENRLLDSNAKESVPVGDDKEAGENGERDVNKPKGKVAVSGIQSNGSTQTKDAKHKKSHSDASGSSSGQSAAAPPTASLGSSKLKPKPSDQTSEEVSPQPTDPAPRSTSNPKERPAQVNAPTKKRLSLPNNGKSSTLCCLFKIMLPVKLPSRERSLFRNLSYPKLYLSQAMYTCNCAFATN